MSPVCALLVSRILTDKNLERRVQIVKTVNVKELRLYYYYYYYTVHFI
jgi:hypothetical protein